MVKESLVDRNGHYAPSQAYFTRYGKPEKVYYDAYSGDQVYAWPSQGFALAGNKELNEVYQTIRFQPTTIEKFEVQFASQFEIGSHPGREGQ